MITGKVSPRREAVITLTVRSPGGDILNVDAIVDTGFTDPLTLPLETIVALGLRFLRLTRIELGDHTFVWSAVYEGLVLWDSQWRTVPIHESDTDPLIGMALMHGYRLCIEIVPDGPVTLEKVP